ncbi:hypothetical protein GCM10028791_15870 [Echinicola sediminis]
MLGVTPSGKVTTDIRQMAVTSSKNGRKNDGFMFFMKNISYEYSGMKTMPAYISVS